MGADVEVVEKGNTGEPGIHHHIGADMEVGEIRNRAKKKDLQKATLASLFHGKNLKRVIFSGIPWACEGLGVYGIGVFLPILVMALGLEPTSGTVLGGKAIEALHRIINSVEITVWINLFILPGFALGLFLINRWYHVRIQVGGFILCALGLTLLLVAYKFHLPVWLAIAGFMIFELFLNAGPHLMTFIIPSQIYPVADRGEGAGLAAAIGKAGAVLGVLFIPMLLSWGGVELVLLVSIFVQIIGAVATGIIGREVLPDKKKNV